MRKISVFIFLSLLFILLSCTSYKSQKMKMIGKWEGSCQISFDSTYIPKSKSFPYSDSLQLYYKNFGAKNFIKLELNDSFAIISRLNFYQNRVFAIDWTPLKAGNDYIVLWCYKNESDFQLLEKIKHSADNWMPDKDSLAGNNFILEMFDVTKDREIIFLKDIKLTKDSMFCNVETDMVIVAKQKLLLKKVSDK